MTTGLELPPHLEPQWREEVAHAVVHLGLIGAVRGWRRDGADTSEKAHLKGVAVVV